MMKIHASWARKIVDFLVECVCRSAKSIPTIAVVAVTREVCCIGAVWKGTQVEVLTGMSNVHSLGDMSTNSSTVVERHIMAVECVYDDARGHQATWFKGRVIVVVGCGKRIRKCVWITTIRRNSIINMSW